LIYQNTVYTFMLSTCASGGFRLLIGITLPSKFSYNVQIIEWHYHHSI